MNIAGNENLKHQNPRDESDKCLRLIADRNYATVRATADLIVEA